MLLYNCGDFRTWPRGFGGNRVHFFEGWFMTHCCPPLSPPPPPPHPSLLPSQIAAEGRGTAPCRPGFSEDVYKVVMPDITEQGQPLFNGEWRNIPSAAPWWILVMSVFDWVCVCVCMCRHANHFVRARLGVLHFREDQNKPDIFKQLALVYLCGIASCVVFLVNQLKCGSGLCGSSPCCLHAVFAFQADTNTCRLLPTCKTVSVAAEKFLQFAFCGDEY